MKSPVFVRKLNERRRDACNLSTSKIFFIGHLNCSEGQSILERRKDGKFRMCHPSYGNGNPLAGRPSKNDTSGFVLTKSV